MFNKVQTEILVNTLKESILTAEKQLSMLKNELSIVLTEQKRLECNKTVECSISINEQLNNDFDEESKASLYPHIPFCSSFLTEIVSITKLPTPFLYPTLNNELRAEWPIDGGFILLFIDPYEKFASVSTICDTIETPNEYTINLDALNVEMTLSKLIRKMIDGQ